VSQYDQFQIGKIEFLKVISAAFELAFSPSNVNSSFEKAGITSLEFRASILSKLKDENLKRAALHKINLATPPETQPSIIDFQTLRNITEVNELELDLETMINQLTLDDHPQRYEIAGKIYKLSKATKPTIAHNLTISHDFDDLHKAQAPKKEAKQRKGQKSTWNPAEGRILDLVTIEEREQWIESQYLQDEVKIMMFFPSNLPTIKQRQGAKEKVRKKKLLTEWQKEKEREEYNQQHLFISSLIPGTPASSPRKSPAKLTSKASRQSPKRLSKF
jgi:hypothetical protein